MEFLKRWQRSAPLERRYRRQIDRLLTKEIVVKEDSTNISRLAVSIPPRLAEITADADRLSNALTPSALPEMPSSKRYRVVEGKHALQNAINRISVAAADFLRAAELLKN